MPSQGNFQVSCAIIFLFLNIFFWTATGSLGKSRFLCLMHQRFTHLFFTANDLQGNIPSEFGKLHELVWFVFEYNRISGAIPSSLFNISSLKILKTRHNYLMDTFHMILVLGYLTCKRFSFHTTNSVDTYPLQYAMLQSLKILKLQTIVLPDQFP